MISHACSPESSNNSFDNTLFQRIADDLRYQGYSINPGALPADLTHALLSQLEELDKSQFDHAGIGRQQQHMQNNFVRSDEICWITGVSSADKKWLGWSYKLQLFLNRQLILGLFSFESHFAHYAPGDFYKRHYDSFKGEANRVLSIVVYLNQNWLSLQGGELVIYQNARDLDGIKIQPGLATVVVFLSEDFPHEVLPANRDRYSIAGWYRVNTTTADKVDPPT